MRDRLCILAAVVLGISVVFLFGTTRIRDPTLDKKIAHLERRIATAESRLDVASEKYAEHEKRITLTSKTLLEVMEALAKFLTEIERQGKR